MSEQNNNVVSVKLMDQEFKVKCPPDKFAELQDAANHLDIKMREVCEGNKILSLDRLIVIAALNIAHEYGHLKKEKNYYIDTMNKRIQDLQQKIDQALDST